MNTPRLPRVVMASGVWDLLHRGHINLLFRAKQLGDVLVVGVVSDSGVRAYKGRLPTQTQELRMKHIQALGFVDVVLRQHGTDPSELLHRVWPDVFVHGDDWDRLREGHETLDELCIEYVSLPYTQGISTTQLRAEMAS